VKTLSTKTDVMICLPARTLTGRAIKGECEK
jgi:hypothetical protein